MDISIPINKIVFNLRVTIILEADEGFIFEKDKLGFYFPIGGRIKINENSMNAAIREINEELGIEIKEVKYIGMIENFFSYDNKPYHEIDIVHDAKFHGIIKLPEQFFVFNKDEIMEKNIITNNKNKELHFIEKNNSIIKGHPCPVERSVRQKNRT